MENMNSLTRDGHGALAGKSKSSDGTSTLFSTVNNFPISRWPSLSSYRSLDAALHDNDSEECEHVPLNSALNRLISQPPVINRAPPDRPCDNWLHTQNQHLPHSTSLLLPAPPFSLQFSNLHKPEPVQQKQTAALELNWREVLGKSNKHHSAPVLVLYFRHSGFHISSSCQPEAFLQAPDNISNHNEAVSYLQAFNPL